MYIKLIDPKKHGQKVYDNKESSLRTLNYLGGQAVKGNREAVFFNSDTDGLSKQEVMLAIDNNVKGLTAKNDKFYSLLISPSVDELEHIKNDEQLLKDYTRKVMEKYANNFKLKDGIKLSAKDLVWAATIHQERAYRGTDKEVLEGRAKSGEYRPGLQTHVHIILSARDKSQKITLNPGGSRKRFNLVEWQKEGGLQFEKQFKYTAQEREKVKEKLRDKSRDKARAVRIGERVDKLNKLLPLDQQLDGELIKKMAQGRQYDKTFYRSLKRLEMKAQEGKPLGNAYHLLQTGKIEPRSKTFASQTLRALQQATRSKGRDTRTESLAAKKGKSKDELDIEM